MAVGEDSPFIEHHDRHLDFQNPLRTPSNIRLSPAALDDLLTPDIAWWCASYPRGMYNTSFGSFGEGSPPILFSHLKNGSFLIWSTILCIGSLNATFTSPICASGSCILKSFRGLKGKMPCRERFNSDALPLLCSQSSTRRLYSSIHLMSCLISSRGLFFNDSRSSKSSGSPILKVLAAIFLLPPPISL